MRGRADAGVRVGHLLLVLLDVGEELLEVVSGKIGARDQRHRHVVDETDVLEIAKRVVAQLPVERRRRRHADMVDEDGVAVGLGILHLLRREDAARARLVLHDDRVAKRLRHRLRHHARHRVGRAARRIRHEHGDVLGRVLLRAGAAGGKGERDGD